MEGTGGGGKTVTHTEDREISGDSKDTFLRPKSNGRVSGGLRVKTGKFGVIYNET